VFETVAEVPVPADMVAKDEEMFAVDCESIIESNASGQAFGRGADDDDTDW
jgi:hypothetical protein